MILAAQEPSLRARWLMGTVCEIAVHGAGASRALTAAFEEIARLDRVMSLHKQDSELSTVNRAAPRRPTRVSSDLWAVLLRSAEAYRASGGAFDPTAGSAAPGFDSVELDPAAHAVRFLKEGVRIDLGGIGKGYALDAAAAVLRRSGVASARLNFGGQLLAVGAPPGSAAWEMEVAGTGLRLKLRDRSVSVSSQSERPGHILAPATGRPVARGGSIAVVAADAATADAWSTALFVSGLKALPQDARVCAIEAAPGRLPIFAGDCGEYIASEDPRP